MPSLLIKEVLLVNEGRTCECDVLIRNGRIQQLASNINATKSDQVIEGNGRYLLPGMIDDQVHFRGTGPDPQGRHRDRIGCCRGGWYH